MKHLGKIVVVAAIAALSLSCASALAKGDSGKTGKLIPSAQLDSEETSKRGGKDGAKKPELTEEEKAERAEKAKEKLAEKLEEGKITQEEYDAELEKIESGNFGHGRKGGRDGAKKPELTEEEKAERAEKAKEKLAEKLEEGKITQEEYDAELEKIESGDFEHDRKGGKGHSKPQSKTENAAATE